MSYTLLTSDEIITFLTSNVVMNGDNEYPKGIHYSYNAPGAPRPIEGVYDANAVYFLGSDNKYVRYAGPLDIKVADSEPIVNKIMAATSGRAHTFESAKIYKDTTPVEANPDGSVVEDEYYVGNDTLVLGKGTAGSADYSIIQGVDLYGLKTSKYLMAVGYRTNITNSGNVIGALSKSVVDNVHGALLLSDDSINDNDSAKGYTIKNSSGVAVLARDYAGTDILYSVENVHASIVFGIGASADSGVVKNSTASIIATHDTADTITNTIALMSQAGNLYNATDSLILSNQGVSGRNLNHVIALGKLDTSSSASVTLSNTIIGSYDYQFGLTDIEKNAGLVASGYVDNYFGLGQTTIVAPGSVTNIIQIGLGTRLNNWSPYMQMEVEPSAPNTNLDCIYLGDGINSGYDNKSITCIGEDKWLGCNNSNIVAIGNSYNASTFGCTLTYTGTYDVMTIEDAQTAVLDTTGKYASTQYVIIGSGTITCDGKTFTMDESGITSYVYFTYDSANKKYTGLSIPTFVSGVRDNDVVHITVAEFEKMLAMPIQIDTGKKYILHGTNETGKITCGDTTVTLDASGVTSYVSVIYTYTPDSNAPTDTTKGTHTFSIELCEFDYNDLKYTDLYGPMPNNNHNVVSIGDAITHRSNTSNSIFYGDRIGLGATTVMNSIIIESDLELGNYWYRYTSADRTKSEYKPHQLKGVFWYDTDTGMSSLGYNQWGLSVLDSGYDLHTHDYSDAFAFVNSQFHNSMFFGIFWDPMTTMAGFSLEDALSGKANKPDAPMIYTGGIALGGRGDGSGYGLMKVGDMYTSIASYIKTSWTTNDYNADNDVVLTPGTSECPYGGMPLLVKSQQEYDGTFRIGAGKVDARGVNIKSIGEALSASGFGGGFQSTYGISAYINTSTSTDEEIGYDYDTKTLTPKSGAMYAVHFPDDDTPLVLADPTDDDLGKQFIIHTIYSTNNGVNGCNSFIKYKCVRFSTSSQGTPGGDNKYAFLVPPLPAILDAKDVMDGCEAATTRFRMDSAGQNTIGYVTAGTNQVVGSSVPMNVGTVENWSVGYSVIMTVIKVPKFSTSSPYVQTLDDGYELCYMPTPLSPIYYC